MSGGARGGDDDSLMTDINVTPLVDVMLCLLVIFMVTTTYVVADSIKVDLPNASTGETTPPSTLAILYNREHKLFMNGIEITEPELRAKVKEEVAKNKDTQAIMNRKTPRMSVSTPRFRMVMRMLFSVSLVW